MANSQHYDAVVIGAGQGGSPLAGALAAAGRKTAIIEREHVGGTCINEGCTPTKTMVASAKVAYLDRRSADYGVQNGPVDVDMVEVRQRKRDIVDSFRSGSEQRLEDAEDLDLSGARPASQARRTLEVRLDDGETAPANAPTMSSSTSGPGPAGFRSKASTSVPTLNSTTIMELDEVPEHLLVLGGGYVGLEFAQMFRRFGSEVTIVQRGPQLLAREDADMAEAVAEILREDGVEVLLGTEAHSVRQDESGEHPANRDTDRTGSARSQARTCSSRPAVRRTRTCLTSKRPASRRDKRGFVEVERETGDQRTWRLRPGRRQGRSGLHPHLLRRLPDHRANLLEGGDATIATAWCPTPSLWTRSSGGSG